MEVISPRQVPNRKPRYLSQAAITDGAANLIVATMYHGGNNDTYIEIWKCPPGGVWSILEQRPSSIGKMDAIGACQSGANLHVFPSSHPTDSQTALAHDTFLNVCVPYPTGVQQVGMAGAHVPTQAPEVEVDYTRIQQIVQAEIRAEVQRAIENLKPKARAAIDEAFNGGQGSFQVYQQLTNTAYSAAMNAIRDSGLSKPQDGVQEQEKAT